MGSSPGVMFYFEALQVRIPQVHKFFILNVNRPELLATCTGLISSDPVEPACTNLQLVFELSLNPNILSKSMSRFVERNLRESPSNCCFQFIK